MKYALVFIACFSIFSCKTKSHLNNKNLPASPEIYINLAEAPTKESKPKQLKLIYDDTDQNLSGTWTLLAIDAFTSSSNLDQKEELKPGDIVWNFVNQERGGNKLYVRDFVGLSEKKSFLTSGEYNYWPENCLVQIGNKKFKYKIHQIIDGEDRVIARDLVLEDNLNLNLADGGFTIRFRSTDAYWACGVGDEANTRPQWAPLVNEALIQPFEKEENRLSGKWRLISYSAFTSDEMLPDYADENVIWKFGKEDRFDVVFVEKTRKIKNDYSLANGKYNYLTDQCLLQIGQELYYYSLSKNEDNAGIGKTILTLNSGTEPGIADEEQYFYFEKI